MRVDRAVFIVCLANMRVERTETELEAFDHKNFFNRTILLPDPAIARRYSTIFLIGTKIRIDA